MRKRSYKKHRNLKDRGNRISEIISKYISAKSYYIDRKNFQVVNFKISLIPFGAYN